MATTTMTTTTTTAPSSERIVLSPLSKGVYSVPRLTAEAAERASSVLQENHEKWDIFFNDSGFHNHIVHHICTTFALGATPDDIQRHYDRNASYQRPPPSLEDHVVQDLYEPAKFLANLTEPSRYRDYLMFFQKEITKKGYEDILNEYVFKGDERANIMFARLYAGFLHPIIHLGFGVEFQQPAIVAEALAQAAIHSAWQDEFFFAVDEEVKRNRYSPAHLVDILDNIRADKKLSGAVLWEDDNKIRDGILVRAKDEMVKYASQWRVEPDRLEEAVAEMTNAAVYFTGGAQHPPKQIKFDFFYMHAVNSSLFFSSFIKQPWISTANKVKLLEWKGRLDLCLYASRGSPTPLLEEIANYVPKGQPSSSSEWSTIFERVNALDDDGHACKFIRTLAHAERICAPWEGSETFRIKGHMWIQLGNMVIDSVEGPGANWVRSAGFDEAWEEFEDRPKL